MPMAPNTQSSGSLNSRPQATIAAVTAWPATAIQRICTSERMRTPPRPSRKDVASSKLGREPP